MNENLDVDFAQNAIESLKQSILDLGTVINGLPAKMVQNVDFSQLKEVAVQSIQLDCDGIIDAVQKALRSSSPLLAESIRESLAKQLSDEAYLDAICDYSMSILGDLDIEEPEKCSEIPIEKVQPVLDEMERCLPREVAEVVDDKVANSKTLNNKLSLSDWIAIVGIFVSIIVFFAEQASSNEHDRKEEAHWSAMEEYQQEMLDYQKQEAERSESFQQSVEEHFKVVENFDERIAKALEVIANQAVELDDQSQSIIDPVDSLDEFQNHEAVQDDQQKIPDTEE